MRRQLLLVDTRSDYVNRMRESWSSLCDVRGAVDFASARAQLLAEPPDLLVTSLRLREYNGLHLLYLAAHYAPSVRTVVYSEHPDLWLLNDLQAMGAFFETSANVAVAIPAYL